MLELAFFAPIIILWIWFFACWAICSHVGKTYFKNKK